jgi:hypothetical protein
MRCARRTMYSLMYAVVLSMSPVGWNESYARYMTWDDTEPQDLGMLHAEITGDLASLKRYHEEIQGQFRLTNLEDAYIACVGCEKLAAVPPESPVKLHYFYMRVHSDRPTFFEHAKATVNAVAGLSVTVTLNADLTLLAVNSCPAMPAGCVGAPWCLSTDSCDKRAGAPCQRCVP